MSVINVAPIESMARRALVKNLKNHIGNSLMAINNVRYLLSVALPGTGFGSLNQGVCCGKDARRTAGLDKAQRALVPRVQ
jgi:hypothetical protein